MDGFQEFLQFKYSSNKNELPIDYHAAYDIIFENNKQYDTMVYNGKIDDNGDDNVYKENIEPIISDKLIDVKNGELVVLETANALLHLLTFQTPNIS